MDILRLVLVCMKVGALVFGGGLVMIPLLEPDVVGRYEWVSHEEFMDAVAMGQVTPGPLLVTATFIGYKLGAQQGWVVALAAAAAATGAMFLPSFVMTLVASRQLDRLQANPKVQDALKGIGAGVVGLVAASAVVLVRQGAIADVRGIALGAAALIAMVRFKVDASLVVVVGGVLGVLLWAF